MLFGWELIIRPLSLVFTGYKSSQSRKPSVVSLDPIGFSPCRFLSPLSLDFFVRVFVLGILSMCPHIVLMNNWGIWLYFAHESFSDMVKLV